MALALFLGSGLHTITDMIYSYFKRKSHIKRENQVKNIEKVKSQQEGLHDKNYFQILNIKVSNKKIYLRPYT